MIKTSTLRQIYEDEVLRISVDLGHSILHLHWLQHPSSEQFRQSYRNAILVALEYKTTYWLSDFRPGLYVCMADQHWVFGKMRPLLKGGKIRKLAIVLQPETLMMIDQQALMEKDDSRQQRKKELNIDFFFDIESAHSWFEEENTCLGSSW